MPFAQEPTGYDRTILSDLQGGLVLTARIRGGKRRVRRR